MEGSRDRNPVVLLLFRLQPNQKRRSRQEERKSMKVSRKEERRERGSGDRKRKDWQAVQEWRSRPNRNASPRGSVCRPGLASGRRFTMKKEDGSEHKSLIKWSTPSYEECGENI